MRIALIVAGLLIASPCLASTPDAWDALDRDARKTCEQQIRKFAPKNRIQETSGRVIGIGSTKDGDRYYGLILSGKAASFATQWLCLYDKRDKTAVARQIEKP